MEVLKNKNEEDEVKLCRGVLTLQAASLCCRTSLYANLIYATLYSSNYQYIVYNNAKNIYLYIGIY